MQIPQMDPGLWASLLKFAQSVVVVGVTYTARKMYTLDKRVQRVETILTGPDGDNGMRSDVGELKDARQRSDRALVKIGTHLGIEDIP